MSIEGRIRELSDKHRKLDEEIQIAEKAPAQDHVKTTKLKREKLRVKEELRKLDS